MTITTTITEREYIAASLHMFFSKIIIRIIFIIFGGYILFSIPYALKDGKGIPIIILSLFTPALMIGITWYSAKRNYISNKFMSEPIDYTFGENTLTLKSSSFNSELNWDKVFKVTQNKHWVLIWTNNQLANPIARKHFTEEQIAHLKIIVDRNKVKNNF